MIDLESPQRFFMARLDFEHVPVEVRERVTRVVSESGALATRWQDRPYRKAQGDEYDEETYGRVWVEYFVAAGTEAECNHLVRLARSQIG